MNPLDSMVTVVNNGLSDRNNLMVQAKVYDMDGKDYFYSQVFNSIGASSVRRFFPLNDFLKKMDQKNGVFVSLKLMNEKQEVLSENIYWLADKDGNYKGLQDLKSAALKVNAVKKSNGKVEVALSNPAGNPVAFFNRVALVDSQTGKRILPAFYDDNYVSVLPGENRVITIEYKSAGNLAVEVYGWNVERQKVNIQ